MHRYNRIVAAVLGLFTAGSQANSLVELINNVPAPPQDMATGVSWVQNGQFVEPNYVRFKQALEAERAATLALNGGVAPVLAAPPAPNAADPADVQAAVRGFDAYLADNSGDKDPKTALNKRTRWLQAAMGQSMVKVMAAIKPCPYPCQDPAIVAANAPAEAAKADIVEHDLRTWTSLFQDWKNTRTPIVMRNAALITAAADGSKATTPEGKAAMAQYRAAMLQEIDLTLSITELAVRRTDAIARNQVDAISSATRAKPKTN